MATITIERDDVKREEGIIVLERVQYILRLWQTAPKLIRQVKRSATENIKEVFRK